MSTNVNIFRHGKKRPQNIDNGLINKGFSGKNIVTKGQKWLKIRRNDCTRYWLFNQMPDKILNF